MNADLLAMLGGGAMGGAVSDHRRRDEGKVILSIKAGKMTSELQENGKFKITPVKTRGEINLIWQPSSSTTSAANARLGPGTLKFEWKDRRTNAKDLESTIFPDDGITFSKIGRETDRVYLMQYGSNSPERRHFFWLQDKVDTMDKELIVKMNLYLCDRIACATEAGDVTGVAAIRSALAGASASTDPTVDGAALSQALRRSGAGTDSTATARPQGAPTATAGQMDALSSILQNLGIPPPAATSESTSTSAQGKQLTLADLQGAMAGLATTSPVGSPTSDPPLNEIANADAVVASGILENENVKSALIALLPEGQQTEKDLLENLRSPQLQQSMKSLSSAISGDVQTFNEVIANFQMDPSDGAAALATGSPIQAFIDCLLAKVKEKKDEEEKMEE